MAETVLVTGAGGRLGREVVAQLAARGTGVSGRNTLATYCVLDAACEVGVHSAVIASSIAATGLSFSPHHAHPAWLPIDVDLPTQAADPYGLSKVTDEQTAAMMSRRSGLTVSA